MSHDLLSFFPRPSPDPTRTDPIRRDVQVRTQAIPVPIAAAAVLLPAPPARPAPPSSGRSLPTRPVLIRRPPSPPRTMLPSRPPKRPPSTSACWPPPARGAAWLLPHALPLVMSTARMVLWPAILPNLATTPVHTVLLALVAAPMLLPAQERRRASRRTPILLTASATRLARMLAMTTASQ